MPGSGGLIGALRVTLGLDTANFEAGSRRARTMARQDAMAIQKSLDGVKNSFKGLIAAATVGAFTAAAKRALEYASSLGEVAQQLGVTTKELQEYRYAGSQVGIATEDMDKALAKLTKTIGEAKAGSKAQATTFRELGVAIQDANGKVYTAGEVIPKIADALAKIKDPATRARLEVELFGRAGQKLDTLLAGGSAAVNNLRDAAQKLGVVLSDDQIQRADETADKLSAIKQVLEARIAGVVADNAGAIVSLANALGQLANALGKIPAPILGALAGAALGGRVAGITGAIIGAAGGLVVGDKVRQGQADSNTDLEFRRRALKDSIKRWRETPSYSGSGSAMSTMGMTGGPTVGPGARDAAWKEVERQQALFQQATAARARANAKPGATVPDGGLPTVSGGKHRTPKPPKDRTAELTERFNKELAGLQDDQLQLTQQLSSSIDERVQIEQRRIRASQDAYNSDVDSRQKQGELTQAQADQLKAARASTSALEQSVAWNMANAEKEKEAYSLASDALDVRAEQLQLDEADARTAKDRRALALKALDLDIERQQLLVEHLQALYQLNQATDGEVTAAEDRLRAMQGQLGQRQNAARRSTMGPLESYLDSIPKTIDEMDEAFQNAAVNGLGQFKASLADALLSGQSLFDVLMSGLRQFTSQLLQLQFDQAFKAILGGISPSSSGGGGGGLLSGLLKGALGAAKGASGGITPGASSWLSGVQGTTAYLPGFASGGSLRIGGNPGRDRNMLSINGVPRARVSANENINISAANDRGDGPRGDTYNLHLTIPGATSDRDARRTGAQAAASFQRKMAQTTKQGIS